ncbi:MAG: NAD(P)/FAD-dependent oxidoreductase [Pseudomonadota bacterium]
MLHIHGQPKRYDALIVGARPAGAATAMLLARAGLRVLMIDKAEAGTDTLSTHALMRAGVTLLDRFGVLEDIIRAGTPAVRQASFSYDGERTTVDIKPKGHAEGLYAPRRTVLDKVLAEAASAAGVEISYRTALEELRTDDNGRVKGAILRGPDGDRFPVDADIVIGADGRNSAVARVVGAKCYALSKHRTSVVYGYFDGIEDQGYQWFYSPGCSLGMIPTNDGLHCVFAAVPPADFKATFGGDPLAGLKRIAARCHAALDGSHRYVEAEGRLRPFIGAPGHMRQSFGPGWALVGDAGYFKDPITAHGITDALRDASMLSDAITAGGMASLAAYQMKRDRLSWPLFKTTDAIAALDWSMDGLKAEHAKLHEAMRHEMAEIDALPSDQRVAA